MFVSIKDEPGTQREYETVFILRPETNHDMVGVLNSRVRAIVDQMGGKVLRLENWGKRKLAYEIKKQLKGIYMYWRFLGTTVMVAEIERNLRMMEPVIRYLTVKIDENVVADHRESVVTDETYIKAASTIPDEEEIVLGSSAKFKNEDDDMDEFHPDLEEMKLSKNGGSES